MIDATKNKGFLERCDPELYAQLLRETHRQQDHLELIASENRVSPAVLEAAGSILTNKYAEGYPGRRYYGGCTHVDAIETLAIERAKKLFGAEHVNVQPHSGSQANAAVYLATLQPGDTILSMRLDHGGHLTHGHSKNFSGMLYRIVHYGVDPLTECIDYTNIAALAQEHSPKLIVVGASAYPRTLDFERMQIIAQACGAYLLVDMAHIAGLVVGNAHPSPVPYADFVTTTTHKTLRGPRGGLILCKAEFAQRIDAAVFPGIQGGPLMHIIAAKAVCFLEAAEPAFQSYAQQVVRNAQALAESFIQQGHRLVSGGTDNHLLIIDLTKKHPNLDGKTAQTLLDQAHITCNRNTIPGETRSPFKASGLRIGSAAITTRGLGPAHMATIAQWVSAVLDAADNPTPVIEQVKEEVKMLLRGACAP